MVERMTRWLTRLAVLLPGRTFPLPVTLWQTGDVVGRRGGRTLPVLAAVAAPAVSGVPLFVITPPMGPGRRICRRATPMARDLPETIAAAPGCLEELVEAIAGMVRDSPTE
jgi:hypothetical protein